jgi:SAM-dependent methyltransferase
MVLPSFYHAHHSRDMEDLPFWLGLARKAGSPILELGCGTGRLLAPLAKAGLEAYGLDREARWLAFLLSNLDGVESPPAKGSTRAISQVPWHPLAFVGPHVFMGPHVFVGDMTAFHLALDFALIFLPCNTFSTLSRAERLATLDCVRRHLRPGGLFAASLPNPAALKRLPRKGESEMEEEFFSPESGDPVQVSSAWERNRDVLVIWWHYDHLFPDGRVERTTVETHHLLADVSEYRQDLALAGLKTVEENGDYDGGPFREDSPYWIFITSRSG